MLAFRVWLLDFAFSGVSAIFHFLVLLLLIFSSFSAVLLFVVYVNKLVELLLLAVKAYVFFVTGLLFNVGVDRLAAWVGAALSRAGSGRVLGRVGPGLQPWNGSGSGWVVNKDPQCP